MAEALVRGLDGLVVHYGTFYLWYGGRWKPVGRDYVEDLVWRRCDGSTYLLPGGGFSTWRADRKKVSDVVRALESRVRMRDGDLPVPCGSWAGWSEEPGFCISFRDVVVDLKADKDRTRDRDWFDPFVVPVDLDRSATCPLWTKCLNEWSCGDPTWVELLQRWFGYCLMGDRRMARWLLMQGKVRSGKGTISRVLQALLPGGFCGRNLIQLGSRFGLWGIEKARILCVYEVSEMDNRDGEHCSMILKSILGEDAIMVDRKLIAPLENVVLRAAPIVQANEIPRLPNKGRGLSSKMLVLPFDHSFLGKEDPELLAKLKRELRGIAAWALQGAYLVANSPTPSAAFPVPVRGEEAAEVYRLVNNPFDAFLESRFVRDDEGMASYETLWRHWRGWAKKNGIAQRIARNKLPQTLIEQSTWDLARCRPHGGERCLRGLAERRSERFQEVG